MRKIRDYDEDYVTSHTPWGLFLKLAAALFAVAVVLSCGGFFFGWFKTGVDVISPDNVKAQWQFAYDYDESLKGIAGQWCTAKAAENAETNQDAKIQRSSQRIAVENNYNRVKAEYDGRLRDAFRAKWVKPPDVPNRAPTLEEAVAARGGCGP